MATTGYVHSTEHNNVEVNEPKISVMTMLIERQHRTYVVCIDGYRYLYTYIVYNRIPSYPRAIHMYVNVEGQPQYQQLATCEH